MTTLNHRHDHILHAGWTRDASPFHEGEQAAQERVGVREQMEGFGRRMIRDWMPDQHRLFFESLPYVVVGSLDAKGHPWASFLVGEPGFIQTPNEHTIAMAIRPVPGDPVHLTPGGSLGLLGIDLEARRRNRAHGLIEQVGPGGVTLRLAQSFGNCPQYIQSRAVQMRPDRVPGAPIVMDTLNTRARQMIETADTFFIATTHRKDPQDTNIASGVDVSHRGGKPGFVRLEGDTLWWPDFSGNNHFNTIGNLLVYPQAGHLFVDFTTGDALYLTGRTAIVWDGPKVRAFEGAQRLVAFTPEQAILIPRAVPMAFDFIEYSPYLDWTGQWTQPGRQAYVVRGVSDEIHNVRSIQLAPRSGEPAPTFKPGQHVEVDLPVGTRRYSLSGAPGAHRLRLSIERHPHGTGSGYIHDTLRMGDVLELSAPQGNFTLHESPAPTLLLAGGVGITPLMSMLHALSERPDAQVSLIWSVRDQHFFHDELALLQRTMGDRLTVHIQRSRTDGRIDLDLLRRLWPGNAPQVYLCGSLRFDLGMRALLDQLPTASIRSESFGGQTTDEEPQPPRPVTLHDTELEWTGGTLLDLAIGADLDAPFSCRVGACGSCQARICGGSVEYDRTPSFEAEPGHALMCVGRPGPDGVKLAW